MRGLSSTFLMGFLVLTLGACASREGPATGPLPPGAQEQEARVQVTNNNWSDMTVYAVRDGHRVRLGTVTSMATQIFDLPRAILGAAANVQLVANPIGGRSSIRTPPVSVWPGQTVQFMIENQPGLSNTSVW